jgi:hypothetical protein
MILAPLLECYSIPLPALDSHCGIRMPLMILFDTKFGDDRLCVKLLAFAEFLDKENNTKLLGEFGDIPFHLR